MAKSNKSNPSLNPLSGVVAFQRHTTATGRVRWQIGLNPLSGVVAFQRGIFYIGMCRLNGRLNPLSGVVAFQRDDERRRAARPGGRSQSPERGRRLSAEYTPTEKEILNA